MRHAIITAILLLSCSVPAVAQQPTKISDVATISAEVVPAKARPGEVVTFRLTVTPKRGWYTYTAESGKNHVLPANDTLIFVGTPIDPANWTEKSDPDNFGAKVRIYQQPVTWEIPAVVSPTAAPGPAKLTLKNVSLQICDIQCFNTRPKDLPTPQFEVLPGPAVSIPAQFQAAVNAALAPPPVVPPQVPTKSLPIETPAPKSNEAAPHGVVPKETIPLDDYQAKLNSLRDEIGLQQVVREGGFTLLLLTAAFWGLVSLATPCVFPMIPITVSLFLKQGNQSTSGAMKAAAIYCLTIVLVLGVSAVALLGVFQKLSVSWGMNVFLGVLFIVFALSLFGMYDITLPNSLLRFSEGKRKQGGLIGIVFGAIAFSIVSFTCVAPFLGGFAGMTASGQYSMWELVLAGITFASAFAAPFFLLAMFPSLLKKLPRSGGWLDSVKVVMGFLELAAALKFFRSAELSILGRTTYFTYDIVLAGWVVIAIACGMYLLNLYRLPHDEEAPNIGVPRLVFALMFLGLGVYLLPGIWKTGTMGEGQRPSGVVYEWVDGFLLPEPSAGDLPWNADLPGTIEAARKDAKVQGKSQYIFVDFTGVQCTNCKTNERSVFPLPGVSRAIRKFRLVQMYTDQYVPESFYRSPPPLSARAAEAAANAEFQETVFKTTQLPLYVILEVKPDGAVSTQGTYVEGKINYVPAFTSFLNAPFEKK